jgi:hypothetical protein
LNAATKNGFMVTRILKRGRSCDQCEEEVSAIEDGDMDESEVEFGRKVAVKVALLGTVVAFYVDPAYTAWEGF